MAYSKETERENKALGDLLKGKTPEKRVMVGYKGKEKEKGDIVPKMTELMRGVRMPLFCKKCDKIMKQRLDDKMWRLYGHCFDCQVDVEHRMRLDGTYDVWEKDKIKNSNDLKNLSKESKFLEKEITLFHVKVVNEIIKNFEIS